MISSDTHIIRQQVLDISYTGTTTDGISLQQKMTALCTDELIPALEKILKRYEHINGHVYFDMLEIDLGTFQSDELELKLADVFREKLEFLLTASPLQQLITTNNKEARATDDQFRYTGDTITFAEAFIYFLQKGRLPWTYRLPAGKSLTQVLHQVLNGPECNVLLYKIKQSLHEPKVVRRMVLQIDENTILEILKKIAAEEGEKTEELLNIFPNPAYNSFRHTILEASLIGIVNENPLHTQGEILESAITIVRSDPGVSQQIRIDQIIEVARKHQIKFRPKSLPKGHKIGDRLTAPRTSFPFAAHDSSGLYVDNAGIILLHPFLPMLFEGTGILQNDKIIDPDRALCLLHYLCTGQKEAAEYDLIFSKIICGIPVDEPVSIHITLTPDEIQEADALLSAVIRHWSVLQHTSPDGLRGTFLLRRGKLTKAFDGGWLLQVERQSVDILLDNLPWGFGIVKLPWLSQLIHVEW